MKNPVSAEWIEIHCEIALIIGGIINSDDPLMSPIINKIYYEEGGRGGIYDYVSELTDKFMKRYENKVWDGDFMQEMEDFINTELDHAGQ